MIKELFSVIGIALTIIAFFPYIKSIRAGKTKPHVFSWVIWGVTILSVSFAQLADGAGLGAWPLTVSGIITLYIAVLAYQKRADISITKIDKVFFAIAILSLPIWYLSSDPLWAVLILTGINTIAFMPTFRKAYSRPFEESLSFFAIIAIRNAVSIIALEHYSLTTVLFPLIIGLESFLLVVMVLMRRRVKS